MGDIHGGDKAVISELSDIVFTGNSLETRSLKITGLTNLRLWLWFNMKPW